MVTPLEVGYNQGLNFFVCDQQHQSAVRFEVELRGIAMNELDMSKGDVVHQER